MTYFTAVVLNPDYAVDDCGYSVVLHFGVFPTPYGVGTAGAAEMSAKELAMKYLGYSPNERDVDDWVVAFLCQGHHENLTTPK